MKKKSSQPPRKAPTYLKNRRYKLSDGSIVYIKACTPHYIEGMFIYTCTRVSSGATIYRDLKPSEVELLPEEE